MSQIIADFFQVGTLRFIARVLMGIRGLFIVVSLSPHVLGEYTVWLLFIFYSSMLDFGVLSGLERDIPHYRGLNDAHQVKRCSDSGWSSFFVLSTVASLLLWGVSLVVFRQWMLSFLLGFYLLTDKIYRSFDAASRIELRYTENGIGQLINAAVSLVLVFVLLRFWGPYGILAAFIVAAIASAFFLSRNVKLQFTWSSRIKAMAAYIKTAVPLAVIVYSIQFYHMVALTILAFICDKTTLGHFAFAFRIFYICLALFPFLIQELMRTRMYFHVAQGPKGKPYLENLYYPMGIYCVLTSSFWMFVYWWSDWGINRIAAKYVYSITALKLLTLALLPLGVAKICSDYLCSNVHKRVKSVVAIWIAGILLQGMMIFIFHFTSGNSLFYAPLAYLGTTFFIYVFVTKTSLEVEGKRFPENMRLIYLWVPMVTALFSVYFLRVSFHFMPSPGFLVNVMPFLISLGLAFALLYGIILFSKTHKNFQAFFYPQD